MSTHRTLEERLLEKCIPEPNTGCWLWMGAITTGGYGQIRRRGVRGGSPCAHVASWEVHNGPVPGGKYVQQSCGLRCCINPAHLRLATALTSQKRMAKLDPARVRELRGLYAERRHTLAELARRFGLTPPGVHAVVTRRTWKNVR